VLAVISQMAQEIIIMCVCVCVCVCVDRYIHENDKASKAKCEHLRNV
jgi:hypothetical protein